jgi:hypothetical protein
MEEAERKRFNRSNYNKRVREVATFHLGDELIVHIDAERLIVGKVKKAKT